MNRICKQLQETNKTLGNVLQFKIMRGFPAVVILPELSRNMAYTAFMIVKIPHYPA